MKLANPFVFSHFKACLYRRWIIVKRSWKSVAASIVATLVFSGLAIVTFYMMRALMIAKPAQLSFDYLVNKNGDLAYECADAYRTYAQPYIDIFIAMFRNDTYRDPKVHSFKSRDELNAWFYANRSHDQTPIAMALGFWDFCGENCSNDLIVYWNSSESGLNAIQVATTVTTRLHWKRLFGTDKDFWIAPVRMMQRVMAQVFGYLSPLLVSYGLASIVPLLISQPIVDLTGEVREYMVARTLTVWSYWAAEFVVDMAVWVTCVTLIWAVFLAAQIASFLDNVANVWYSFTMAGPSFILFVYCISFAFGSAASAARQSFVVLFVVIFIPCAVDIIRSETVAPVWLDWVYSFFPCLHVLRMMTHMLRRIGIFKKPLSYYWQENRNSRPYLIMEWVDIIIYGGLLVVIEQVRLWMRKAEARRSFGNYGDFFRAEKARHPVTQEAKDMEAEVAVRDDYAVRIVNCSRLFFSTTGDPIPAVNCVSLGIRKGSLFGFLGANGAGKTTLIRMITSMLPISDGTIEIMGEDIARHNNPTLLSICPQFNTHLCQELTPYEHLIIYSWLFGMLEEETNRETERLIEALGMEEFKDKPIRELSSGDVRKLAIALSFLGPAEIILLDEPTASLDAVARRAVHEMIQDFRGEKTFMLCTHLLSEAETLCDEISIMIKGCVYTVGSPGYLSGKFGTEYKVDVMLVDQSERTSNECNEFFSEHLPGAVLSIERPKARIYTVPAAGLKLSLLFTIMEKGKRSEGGFNYYTCSSSSLERVFMEIIRMSEGNDIEFPAH